MSVHRELDRFYRAAEKRSIQAAGPDIVALLRPVAVVAFQRLAAAVDVVGAVPGGRILNTGPASIAALAEHRSAIATLQTVGIVVSAMVDSGYFGAVGVTDVCLWIARDSTGADVEKARLAASATEGNRFAAVVGAGFVLGINGPEEVAALTARAAEHASSRLRPAAPVVDAKQKRLADEWAATVRNAPAT